MRKQFCHICNEVQEVDKYDSCVECGAVVEDQTTSGPSANTEENDSSSSYQESMGDTQRSSQSEAPSKDLSEIALTLKEAGRITNTVWNLQYGCVFGQFDPDAGPVDFDLAGLRGSEYISRQHAKIYPQNGQWFVADLDSTNGTFLNNNRVTQPMPLRDGDTVALGIVKLLVKLS